MLHEEVVVKKATSVTQILNRAKLLLSKTDGVLYIIPQMESPNTPLEQELLRNYGDIFSHSSIVIWGEHAHAPLPDFFVGPHEFSTELLGYEGSDFIRFNLKGNTTGYTHCEPGRCNVYRALQFHNIDELERFGAHSVLAPTLIDKYNSKSPPHDGIESNAPSSDISLLYIVNLKEDTKAKQNYGFVDAL